MLGIAISRWVLGENGVMNIFYAGAFTLISVFDGILLDLMREVRYIEVDAGVVSQDVHDTWKNYARFTRLIQGTL